MLTALTMNRKKNKFLLLYASETGTAKNIAEEVADTAPTFGLLADLHCVSLIDRRFSLAKESCVVFIVATTGAGEPPATAKKLLRRICSRILCHDHFCHINYALLALGDSNYSLFCSFGKRLEKRLQELSAQKFYATGYADDKEGLEVVADPWIVNLWPALRKHLGLETVVLPKMIAIHRDNFTESHQEMPLSERHMLSSKLLSDENGKVLETSNNINSKTFVHCLSSVIKEMSEGVHKVPNVPVPFLSMSFKKDAVVETVPQPDESIIKLAASELVEAEIVSACRLTTSDASVKKTMELTLQFMEKNVPYEPGDAFGFICSNCPEEVDIFLKRLGIHKVADVPYEIVSQNKKKVPAHVPCLSTLRHVFSSCVDIRTVPKKVLLRILSTFTEDNEERLVLEFLSSHEGSMYYTEYLRKQSLSILDILLIFQSCCPPCERLLEYLPPLKPRFYSVASSPLTREKSFRIIFNIVDIKQESCHCFNRKGVCTGWFERISKEIVSDHNFMQDIESDLSRLSLNSKRVPRVHVYKRQNKLFHLPSSTITPLIMVGPGTGLAPFVGFLQHREFQMQKAKSQADFGEAWLFYGCRYTEKDFLYRHELERLNSQGVLSHLIVSFSRDNTLNRNRYVQDNIVAYSSYITKAIDSGAVIYVCGDAKGMAKDVRKAFADAFQCVKGCSEEDAQYILKKLDNENRYLVDVWT